MTYELFSSLIWAIMGALTFKFSGWGGVVGGCAGLIFYHLVLKPTFGL